MKHIFFVQSSHIELLAASIIASKNLDSSSCHLISLREYEPYSKIQFSAFPSHWRGSFFRPIKRRVFNDRAALVGRFFENLVGKQEFHVYLPQASETFVPILLNQNNCIGFSHVEEGLHASIYSIDSSMRNGFFSKIEEKVWHSITTKRLKPNRELHVELPRPAFTSRVAEKYYHISKNCYATIDKNKREKIPINLGLSYFSKLPTKIVESKNILIVIDSLAFETNIEISSYTRLMLEQLHQIQDLESRDIYLKAHPKTKNQAILEHLKHTIGSEFKELRSEPETFGYPVEFMFAPNLDTIFVGGVSSSLLYAAEAGKQAFSSAPILHRAKEFNRLHHPKSGQIENFMRDAGVILCPQV